MVSVGGSILVFSPASKTDAGAPVYEYSEATNEWTRHDGSSCLEAWPFRSVAVVANDCKSVFVLGGVCADGGGFNRDVVRFDVGTKMLTKVFFPILRNDSSYEEVHYPAFFICFVIFSLSFLHFIQLMPFLENIF